jgi:hypothetical protein
MFRNERNIEDFGPERVTLPLKSLKLIVLQIFVCPLRMVVRDGELVKRNAQGAGGLLLSGQAPA